MRFLAEGPSIPDELIELRARGKVVFFCGAGVSMDAGQPSFFQLTRQVMDKVYTSQSSQVGQLTKDAFSENNPELTRPLDQIFGLLQRDYLADKIEREVVSLLYDRRNGDPSHHRTILGLSSDPEDVPLVVTTNFDLLFERANPGIKTWCGPDLPDLTKSASPTGVVYLHGRMPGNGRTTPGERSLILSSADFGRAYLADGWATRFMRQLLEERTVVLLGYSAGDPPVRYLLEGLHASQTGRLNAIYAFDKGSTEEVDAKWSQLGVKGIAFGNFEDLWQSLDTWAVRAQSSETWRDSFMNLARQSPRLLKPHERGQVFGFARTLEGATAFANSEFPPPAEWLCVFDRHCRFASPETNYQKPSAPPLDPLDLYGLDFDPERDVETEDDEPPPKRLDAFESLPTDDLEHIGGLTNVPQSSHLLPQRLRYLAAWFEKVADQLPALWWAARQSGIHPFLCDVVKLRLSLPNAFPNDVGEAWLLILESSDRTYSLDKHMRWYEFSCILAIQGWTEGVYRLLERTLAPQIVVSSQSFQVLQSLIGETETVSQLKPKDVISFDIKPGSQSNADFQIPDKQVARYLAALRNSFLKAIELAADPNIALTSFNLPAVEADDKHGERYYDEGGFGSNFLIAANLLVRLAEIDPHCARDEVAKWPAREPLIFDKLRLVAVTHQSLLDPHDIVAQLDKLSIESFWCQALERELLHCLRSRLPQLGPVDRANLETKIMAGPQDITREPDHLRRDAGIRLAWLQLQNLSLSAEAERFIADCRTMNEWKEEWVRGADVDLGLRSGSLERQTDPGDLLMASFADIPALLSANSGRSWGDFIYRIPFVGLVEKKPAKALGYLIQQMQNGKEFANQWEDILRQWPTTSTARASWLLAQFAIRLSDTVFDELRFALTDWLKANLGKVDTYRKGSWFVVWDAMLSRLFTLSDKLMKSAAGEVKLGGKRISESRKSYFHASTSPVGKLAVLLLNRLDADVTQRNKGIPNIYRERVVRSLTAPASGKNDVATVLGQRFHRLSWLDRRWTRDVIAPLFALDHPLSEAMWHGHVSQEYIFDRTNFRTLRPLFCGVFDKGEWMRDKNFQTAMTKMAVFYGFMGLNNTSYLNANDLREILRKVPHKTRAKALHEVERISLPKRNGEVLGVNSSRTCGRKRPCSRPKQLRKLS